MGKLDRAKEFIGYLKVVFGILVAIDVSITAWLFKHVETLETAKLVFSLLAVVAVTVAIVIVNRKILTKIDELEDL